MKVHTGFWILILICYTTLAQNNKQIVRGVVVDKLSQTQLIGATVQIIGTTINKLTTTDEQGHYELLDIPPNRYAIKISYVGYQDILMATVVVTSGKEVILDVAMEEDLKVLEAVVITATSKDKPINDLASISSRTFSMEEVNRYAGGRNDPARLAANFAGVSAPDDSRNDIVIRGNSPVGVLWRIDGMNVTNPNHFASAGTTGGAVSALNTNMLKSSDFMTSAFPAEYGNAISGVFDLGFRSGNTQKRETTLQMGVITGLEATTEGPINKKDNSSYLVGYRYSLAGLAQNAGIDIGTTSTPAYQDLSFKLNSGNTKNGKFTLFGILASSTINIAGGSSGTLYGNQNQTNFYSKIGITGLNHFYKLNEKSFLTSTIGLNYSIASPTSYETTSKTKSIQVLEQYIVSKTGYNFITNYNSKITPRLFIKAGIQDELMGLYLNYRTRRDQVGWKQVWDFNSYTNLMQAYIHAKYKLGEKLTWNIGSHLQKFFLNNSFSVEPRVGLKYDVSYTSTFSFGYGLHSQLQPINVYFLQTTNKDGSISYNNRNLDFTKSHHFVLGYDMQPMQDWRLKIEVYYQQLFNVPINTFSSSYSVLNTGASFYVDTEDNLTNAGTGKNYGVELTIEKFFSKGYYMLFTSSLYNSKYIASDGVERSSAFNGKYVFNILGGKEWSVGSDGRNKFNLDIKFTNAGGRPYTPIDLSASQSTGREVLAKDAYSAKYTDYFRLDVKVGYTRNSQSKKLSQSFSLDIQNITNHSNIFSYSYDNGSKSIQTTYQLGLFPNLVYKLQF
jgi:hypothetical protein